MNFLYNLLLVVPTVVIGFVLLCFVAGILNRFLNFKFEIQGVFVWIISSALGWFVFKLLGIYY